MSNDSDFYSYDLRFSSLEENEWQGDRFADILIFALRFYSIRPVAYNFVRQGAVAHRIRQAVTNLIYEQWPTFPQQNAIYYYNKIFPTTKTLDQILENAIQLAVNASQIPRHGYDITELRTEQKYCFGCGRAFIFTPNFCMDCGRPYDMPELAGLAQPPLPATNLLDTATEMPTIPLDIRNLGCYIVGSPGCGKSSLIQHLVMDDIRKHRGVCVIDPTGDLIKKPGSQNAILDWIPESRINDTIFFTTENPVPIDFFSYRNPSEREVLTDQLLDIFQLDNAPVSRPRLQRIIGTLFDANENPDIPDQHRCTFLDILYFIEDSARREQVLSYAPHRKQQWQEKLKPADYISIFERMTPYVESPVLKTMFSAKRPILNIWDIMQDNKIFLVSLRDTKTDAFIGSLISTKFQQATFGRRDLPESERIPYHLYIDECHTILKYAVAEFENILTRARKFNLCLTLANQLTSDLPKEIQSKLSTIKTKIEYFVPPKYEGPALALSFEAFMYMPQSPTMRVLTPKYLDPSPASYAQLIQKRTVDKFGCQQPETVLESKHGDGNDPNPETVLPD
jgi:hypothetical protein